MCKRSVQCTENCNCEKKEREGLLCIKIINIRVYEVCS